MQNNVSLAVIIKNSEDTISTFMSWALDNFPEINIVVDSNNDDDTMGEIFKYTREPGYEQVNIKIHPFDNFSAQWNRAIEMSTKDFCVYMGADEIIEEMPSDSIEKFMDITHSDVGAFKRYNLQRDDEHYNMSGYPDTQFRVIRMSSGIRMDGKVVDESLGITKDTNINVFPWHIIHYGHIRNQDALKLKGKDRLPFAEADDADGNGLREHGEDWFIHRNIEWDNDVNLRSISSYTLKHSRKYWK